MTVLILTLVAVFFACVVMAPRWWTSADPRPAIGDGGTALLTDLLDGVDTAITHYSGVSDPSSGASPAWGSDQVGAIWFDTTNMVGAGGDDLGGAWKKWIKIDTVPTYGWEAMNLFGYVPKEPNVEPLDVAAQSTTAFTDLDLNAITGNRAVRVRLLIEVKDSGSPGAGVYVAVRKNGTTTDVNERRIYPQAAGVPVTQVVEVELEAVPGTPSNKLEYEIAASGAGTFDLRITLLGWWERA